MRVFFSFYFTADHVRARRVMRAFLAHPDTDATGLISPQELNQMAQAGLPAIYAWIEREVRSAEAVVVMAESCELAADIDVARAEVAQSRAEQNLAQLDVTPDEVRRAEFQAALNRARNRLAVSRKASGG